MENCNTAPLEKREKKYSELCKEIPSITEITPSLKLKKLEEKQFVSREVNGEKPPIKVVYNLTDLRRTFLPALEAIDQLGNFVAKQIGTPVDETF